MTFARKIFIAVFLSTLVVGSLLIWGAHHYVGTRAEADFISRYSLFTKILADTLTKLDLNTEALMMNAAQVVAAEDKDKGILSTEELRALQAKLGITHLFIIDSDGNFLRSTNDDPAGIPNLFSFSPVYRKLLTGEIVVEATPVIKPNPEPKPFKFLSIANHDRSRIIEVGVRVDFIANTLADAISSDKNVLKMSLFAPDGTAFGSFSPNSVVFENNKAQLPAALDTRIDMGDATKFYAKVKPSHVKCSQCDVAGTTKDGEYYYVLEGSVSKRELIAIKSQANWIALFMICANAVVAYLLARVISKRIVRNINRAVGRVRKIKEHGSLGERINLDVREEISFLTTEFDRLLDSLEKSQSRLVEAEKLESKVELARVIAHNIKSPILAIEMMLPGMVGMPIRMRNVLQSAVKEIKQLSEKLKTQADSMAMQSNEMETELVYLPIFLRDLVAQKQLEFSDRPILVRFDNQTESHDTFVRVSNLELKSVLSNVINNAADAYGSSGGEILLRLESEQGVCVASVIDAGVGIPKEFMNDLGKKSISFKGDRNRGLGLVHAFKAVKSWGGNINIDSNVGRGTKVSIQLSKYQPEKSPQMALV